MERKMQLRLLYLSLALMTTLSGCGKKADCNIDRDHAHLYVSEEGFKRYLNKENLTYNGYVRQDDYIRLYEEMLDLKEFEEKKNVMLIKDNLALIEEIQNSNEDYIEYRYRYNFNQPIAHTTTVGKTTTTYFTYMPMTLHSWTTNPDRTGLTGETRVCHHMYQAYKIEYDEKGKPVLIKSPVVEDLTTIMDEYPYIKENFTVIVNLEDGQEVDYEDGQEEELENSEELENIETSSISNSNGAVKELKVTI